jgi:sulfate permease, SulP family
VSEYLHNIDKHSDHKRDVLIIGCGINFIDIAGAEMLAQEAQRRRMQRGNLYLCELKPEARQVLERGGYIDAIGADHIFATHLQALANILPGVDAAACRTCYSPLFKQCPVDRHP